MGWIVAGNWFGFDKVVHLTSSAVLVVLLTRHLQLRAAAGVALVVGFGLEVLQSLQLGFEPPSPVGGDAEVADLIADMIGVTVGYHLIRFRQRHRTPPREPVP